jgi:hypothetical protein
MGTTLTGTTPQDTYDSLIKVTDNGPISATVKLLSDGLGNDSALALSTARVGIGTTSNYSFNDDAKLAVANTSGNSTISIVSGTASNGYLAFADGTTGTDRYTGSINYNHSTNAMTLHTNGGNERIRITSAGNVGIGTTAPTALLDIQAAGSAVGSIRLSSAVNTNGAAYFVENAGGGSYFGRNSSTGGAFTGAAYSTVVYGGGAYPMSFYTNDAERMRITSTGNALIGTTSDNGAKLQVNGTANATQFISTTGSVVAPLSTPTTFFTATSNGIYLAHVYLGGSITQTWSATIFFVFQSTNIMIINQTNGVNVSTSVSGTDVRVTQIGGASFTMGFDIIKIA